MDLTLLVVLIANLIYIALLPMIFFRKDGSYNLKWWLTGCQFTVAGITLILGALGILHAYDLAFADILKWVALAFSLASLMLISFTWGTNRVPLSLWHQKNDAPQNIVTYGAYAKIRHPFYTSFLLCLLGCLFFFPHWLTLACFVYGFVVLSVTAHREETRLSASQFGEEYKAYMTKAGRFWPKF